MKKFLPVCIILFFTLNSFGTTWTVVNSGTLFSPDSITITQGDTVLFSLASPHNAQEVDSATWSNNNTLPVTGFNTPVGGGTVTGLTVGKHYYICDAHASFGMKGKIVVKPAPSVQFVITSSAVSEGVGSFGIAVSITNPNSNATAVDVNVLGGGSATSGTDYTYSPVTVVFPPNTGTAQIVNISFTDDQLVEGAESFTFQLAAPTNNATIGANAQHTITINDNDTLKIGLLSNGIAQFENIGTVNVQVQLAKLSPQPTGVTLHLDAANSTATQGSDFTFSDTTITWPANTNGIVVVPLPVINDATVEPDETIRLQLINPTNGAILLNDTFLLVIQNNDTAPALPATIRFITNDTAVAESSPPVTVIAEVNNPGITPVTYIIARNDAASSADITLDYTFPNAQFTHGMGVWYDTIRLHPVEEQLIEPNETAVVNFVPVSSNATFGADSVYTLTIIDNDTLSVAFNGAGFSYVEDTGLVQIKIVISSPVPDTTKVTVKLASGNATRNADFRFNDTIVTFLPNSKDTQSVWVEIINDTVVEANEQINFDLINSTNGARLGIAAYTLTIIDNDFVSGIQNFSTAGIPLFPNPTTGTLFIETETELDICITDILGNTIIASQKLFAGKNVVDVSALSAGMYFVKVQDAEKNFSQRFIKQN